MHTASSFASAHRPAPKTKHSGRITHPVGLRRFDEAGLPGSGMPTATNSDSCYPNIEPHRYSHEAEVLSMNMHWPNFGDELFLRLSGDPSRYHVADAQQHGDMGAATCTTALTPHVLQTNLNNKRGSRSAICMFASTRSIYANETRPNSSKSC